MAADRLGPYLKERVLGHGAFAVVWLAYDEALDARVAIKVLSDNWARDDEVRRRFVDEARLLWRADSTRIIRVHAVGELDSGQPYFVMDWADRGTLDTRARSRRDEGRPLSPPEIARFGIEIAEALGVVHGLGVVHRDIKPSNVLFRSDSRLGERLVLGDLGLAKDIAQASGFTMAAGTPNYMAPEQSEIGGRVDPRTDLFALGTLLGELALDSTADMERRLIDEDVDEDLIAIVRRCRQPDPDMRYPDTAAVIEALRPLAARSTPAEAPTVPGPSGSTSARTPASRIARRPRWAVPATAAACAIAFAAAWLVPTRGAGGPTTAADRSTLPRAEASTPRDPTSMTRTATTVSSPEGTTTIASPASAMITVEVATTPPTTAVVRTAPGAATSSVSLPVTSPVTLPVTPKLGASKRIVDDIDLFGALTFSPDGLQVWYSARIGGIFQIFSRPLAGGPTQQRTFSATNKGWPSMSRDGRHIAFTESVRSGATTQDDILLATVPLAGTARLVSRRITSDPATEDFPFFSADSSRVYFTRQRGTDADIRSVALNGTDDHDVLVGPTSDLAMAVDASGSALLLVRQSAANSDVVVRRILDGTERAITESDAVEADATFSPDGRWVTFIRIIDGGSDVFVVDLESGTETRLTRTPGDERFPMFTPNGRQIAMVVSSGSKMGIDLASFSHE